MKKSDKMWILLMDIGAKYGCHQNPKRSFFLKGYQFPVCARCTGILLIKPLAWLFNFKKKVSWIVGFALLVPMIIDGSIQYIFHIESTNKRRLVTGLLAGFGISTIRINIVRILFKMVKGK